MQIKQTIKDADGIDNSLRHSKHKRGGRGTNSKQRRSKPWKMQIEQTIYQGIIYANKADKAPDDAKKA